MMIAQATSSFTGSSSAASRSNPLMVDAVAATVLMVLLLRRVQATAEVAA